jgi:hypothetical protein
MNNNAQFDGKEGWSPALKAAYLKTTAAYEAWQEVTCEDDHDQKTASILFDLYHEALDEFNAAVCGEGSGADVVSQVICAASRVE